MWFGLGIIKRVFGTNHKAFVWPFTSPRKTEASLLNLNPLPHVDVSVIRILFPFLVTRSDEGWGYGNRMAFAA